LTTAKVPTRVVSSAARRDWTKNPLKVVPLSGSDSRTGRQGHRKSKPKWHIGIVLFVILEVHRTYHAQESFPITMRINDYLVIKSLEQDTFSSVPECSVGKLFKTRITDN